MAGWIGFRREADDNWRPGCVSTGGASHSMM